MGREHHPMHLGSTSYKLAGVWVRHTRTDAVGYIAHAQHFNDGRRSELWIIYPPGRLPDGTRVKTWSAGAAYADEVKKLKRRRKKIEWIHERA